jgi:hypothetical protein
MYEHGPGDRDDDAHASLGHRVLCRRVRVGVYQSGAVILKDTLSELDVLAAVVHLK